MKQACKKCIKQLDKIRITLHVGDNKLLDTATQPFPWKCKNCGSYLNSGDEIFLLEENKNDDHLL